MRLPGASVPSASASRTMALAMRSFTEPVGLALSSLATRRTSGLGLSCDTSTAGVLPIRSSASRLTAMSLFPCPLLIPSNSIRIIASVQSQRGGAPHPSKLTSPLGCGSPPLASASAAGTVITETTAMVASDHV